MLVAIVLAALASASTLLGAPPQLPPLAPAPDPTLGASPAPAAAPVAVVDAGDGVGLAVGAGDGRRYAFEVRDLQVEGLDWRGALKGRARRLQWQAGVMVWAVDEATIRDLLAQVQRSTRSNVVQAPTAVAAAGQSARTLTGSTVQLVVDLERLADGAPGEERGLAYQPILEPMHNGLDMALSATPSDEGLVVGVNLDESTLQGIHTGSFEDALDGASPPDERPILGLFRRRGEGEDPAVAQAGAMKLQASFQVPEVFRSHVEGAWPVKPGESLLISLGARTSSEKWGRSVVAERLVLITARPESAADRSPSTATGPGPSPMLAPPSSSLPASAPPPPLVPSGGNPGTPRP